MTDQREQILWRDGGTPVSPRFDDPFFSLQNGLEETRHVFIAGNDLPGRFRPEFHIAELGFGTGLNFLAALAAWRASGATGRLHFTSFEAFPMPADDMERALLAFPEVASLAPPLVAAWRRGEFTLDTGDAHLEVITGDARETLAEWHSKADAWFLDGFSPAKNPEMWDPALMAEVGRHTVPGGSFATYTAAGFVRRALAEAGFDVTRIPGYGRKRHMTVGTLKAPK